MVKIVDNYVIEMLNITKEFPEEIEFKDVSFSYVHDDDNKYYLT